MPSENIRMDQILANNMPSKHAKLECTITIPISDASDSSTSNSTDQENHQLTIHDFFSKSANTKKTERSKQIENSEPFKESIKRNHEKNKDKIKNKGESRIELLNIKDFFKVVKKSEVSPQTYLNDKNKKRNWDSSSEDESHKKNFSTKTPKKFKRQLQDGKENDGDITKIFEKLKRSYMNKKDCQKKEVEELINMSSNFEEKVNNAKKYLNQSRIENRISSNANWKQPLQKCQSLECPPNKVVPQINSMPLTEKEYKAAEKKVEDEKITFNEFMAKVLRNMHRKNDIESISSNHGKNFSIGDSSSEIEESSECPGKKTILDIIKCLKQKKMRFQEDLHSKENPRKICLKNCSIEDRSQINSSRGNFNNGNEMCNLNYKPESNRSCLENDLIIDSRQCSKYCRTAEDMTQTGDKKTIDNFLEILRKDKQKSFGFSESNQISSSKKQMKINSFFTSTHPKLVETETMVDSSKYTDPTFINIHSPDNSSLKIAKDRFRSDKSKCESESEKSIDFAMYFSPRNDHFTTNSATDIRQQYNSPLQYSSNDISQTFHRNPNSSDDISQNEMDCKCQDSPHPLLASDSTFLEDMGLNGDNLFKIGTNKLPSGSLSPKNLLKKRTSMLSYKVPNVTLLKEILNRDESMEMYNGNEEAKHKAERSEPNDYKINSETVAIPFRTIQVNECTSKPKTSPKKDKKMPVSKHTGENLLDDDLIKTILTENYEKVRRRKESEVKKSGNEWNDLLEKFTQQVSSKDAGNNQQTLRSYKKCYPKRYKKGSLRIYRLKKLKKVHKSTDIDKDNLDFDELLKKMTQDFIEPTKPLVKSKSASSISTTSSYVTDDRSETLSTGSKELPVPQQKLRKGLNEISKDKSLHCEEDHMYDTAYNKDEIKMKIQNIFLRVFHDLTNGKTAILELRRQNFGNCIFKNGRLQFKPAEELRMSVISADVQRSKPKFKLILYILKKIQTLLETNTKLTKRELFYQLKSLIGDQRVTDRAINSISCLLDVGIWALNIVAQKGLVFGNLKLLLASGETLNCNVPGTMIPQDIGEIIEIQSSAYFILVVEKESIFHKLIEEDLPNKLTRSFIMITGKGFPDLNTQLFLRKLWVVMSIPIFILVDADPHGINIMLNYRFGSVNNAHVSHHLAVPKAKWLGVFPSEIGNLNITRQALSERELKFAEDLLKTPYMAENPRIVYELKVLIEKKCKAGIEGLIKSNVFLSEVYLPTKFYNHNFI